MIPLNEFVIIEPLADANKTESGLIIKRAKDDEPQIGHVIAVNELTDEVEVGDKVIFVQYSQHEVQIDDKTYLVVDQKDLLAKFENA